STIVGAAILLRLESDADFRHCVKYLASPRRRLLHPATSRRMLHDVRTPRSEIAMVRAYLNSRGHPPFTTTGRAIVKAYFDSVQNQHAPQSYFAYGGMRTPQEVPARTAPLLAAVE